MALSKAKIKELQKTLQSKGFYDGKVDGDFGPVSLDAVIKMINSKTVVKEVIKEVIAKTAVVSSPTITVTKPVELPKWTTIDPADANKLTGNDRSKYAVRVLIELGWKDYQAAAMVGNFMQESYSDLRTNVWGDKKTAFGIAQWRDNYDKVTGVHTPGRLTDLLSFANDRKKPIDDLDTQVRFADWELKKGSEKGVGKLLAISKNIDEALEAAIGYERPAGYKKENPRAGHGWSRREAFAKSLL
jgi:hypothetical protein